LSSFVVVTGALPHWRYLADRTNLRQIFQGTLRTEGMGAWGNYSGVKGVWADILAQWAHLLVGWREKKKCYFDPLKSEGKRTLTRI